MASVEQQLVRAFVAAPQRRRFLALLETERGRKKLIRSLAHSVKLDPRFSRHLAPPSSPESIEQELRALGAPADCYAISENADIDGQVLSLAEALSEVVGYQMGTFLSCLPGRLAYFEAEDVGERYICHRGSPS